VDFQYATFISLAEAQRRGGKKKMKKPVHRLFKWLVCIALASPVSVMAGEEILIGTGSQDGVYYYAGKSICRMVNTKVEEVSCESLPTAGSLYNLTNLRDGGLDIAIAQSDWQFHAVNGTGPAKYMDGSYENLRSLFSLHAEPFTLVVRRDAGISELKEIVGRRVNLGNAGSGQRATMEIVMETMGWTKENFQLAEGLNASEQSLALCHNRIEAMVYTVGHPNASVAKSVKLCNASIARVDGPEIDKLVADNPYYTYTDIPGSIYPGITEPVRTFGVMATVVTSADLSSETAYNIVKAVFENLDTFKKLHPALNFLTPEKMVKDGLSAELHEGARKYFMEAGLL
jgi:uncharacterized protein